MNIPFSDIPADAVLRHLEAAFLNLEEARRTAARADIREHYFEIERLCQVAIALTVAAKRLVDGHPDDVHSRITVALKELSEIQSRLET